MKLAKIIDNTRCIGCHACSTACKSENEVQLGVDRTRVKYVETGTFPNVRRHFQVTRCNQCEHPPCVYICPVTAMYQRPDGIVEFDQDVCIGCRACMAACPYDAIYMDPDTHSAAKCHFCMHRVEVGLQPACVVVCPEEAIIVGDLEDPESVVSKRIAREATQVRKPELGTQPKLYYIGGSHATLRPEAAARPDADIFMWANQRPGDETVGRGAGNVAGALLAYDVGHATPWGTDVALYMWTKSIAAGVMLVAALVALFGRVAGPASSPLVTVFAPLLAILFLVATTVLLVVDLEKPAKFYTILTRPQWKSWLTRGAVILMGFGIVTALWLLPEVSAVIVGRDLLPIWFFRMLAVPVVLFAAAAAGYTAFLLAQCTGRELWATPLAAPHLVVQALVAGSAALVIAGVAVSAGGAFLPAVFLFTLLAHAAFVAAELGMPHRSPHVSRAVDTIVRGKYASIFWLAVIAAGVALPLATVLLLGAFPLAWSFAAACALVGLFAWEYVWVFGGQAVPLS